MRHHDSSPSTPQAQRTFCYLLSSSSWPPSFLSFRVRLCCLPPSVATSHPPQISNKFVSVPLVLVLRQYPHRCTCTTINRPLPQIKHTEKNHPPGGGGVVVLRRITGQVLCVVVTCFGLNFVLGLNVRHARAGSVCRVCHSRLWGTRPGLVFRFFHCFAASGGGTKELRRQRARGHTRKDAAQSRCCRAEYFGRRCCCRRATEGTGASLGTGRGGTGWKRSCGGGGGGGRRRGGS